MVSTIASFLVFISFILFSILFMFSVIFPSRFSIEILFSS